MKPNPLYSIYFLLSVALLLLNDLYLKYEFHNAFTGKLSDFAGLFAFPYFFAVFFPRQAKAIYIATALLFAFWKSELVQPLLDLAHANGFGFNRMVDYSDLVALAILPLSYKYLMSAEKTVINIGAVGKPVIAAVCCFAFVATSLPREIGEYNMDSDYHATLNVTKRQAEESMLLIGDTSSYLCDIKIEGRPIRISALVTIKELDSTKIEVGLDSIKSFDVVPRGGFFSRIKEEDVNYAKQLTQEEIEQLFAELKIKPLQDK